MNINPEACTNEACTNEAYPSSSPAGNRQKPLLHLFSVLFAFASVVFQILYIAFMGGVVSIPSAVYTLIGTAIFAFAIISSAVKKQALQNAANTASILFITASPFIAPVIGYYTHINSLYTYNFATLSFVCTVSALSLIAFATVENVSAKQLLKFIFIISVISFGLMGGIKILYNTSAFSFAAIIIAVITPILYLVFINKGCKLMFIVLKIANVALLLGLILFYVDMILVFFEISPINIGEKSQLYNLYVIYCRTYLVVPENFAWLLVQYLEAFSEILYPIALLLNVNLCQEKIEKIEKAVIN